MLRLRELREERGLTQAQVAEAIGVTESSISFYESGKKQPSLDKIIKLADYYNLSLDKIVGYEVKII
jgi:transcriptional regulator with XRE-family HTH domain